VARPFLSFSGIRPGNWQRVRRAVAARQSQLLGDTVDLWVCRIPGGRSLPRLDVESTSPDRAFIDTLIEISTDTM